jgi:hypothetical protein
MPSRMPPTRPEPALPEDWPPRPEPRQEPRPEPRPQPRPSRPEPRPPEEPPQKPPQKPLQTSHRKQKPSKKWNVALAAIFVVFGVLAAYDLASSGSVLKGAAAVSHPGSPSASRSHPASPSGGATPAASLALSPSTATSEPVSPTASPSPTVVTRGLTAQSVVAFGPNGASDGDNPGNASLVLAGYGANPWTSSWYATPHFGNLQSGTGLLLDMGHDVSVSTVKVVLGSAKGADVELRLGDANGTPGDLSTVASRSDVGGTIRLKPSGPENGRYVLIWFTKLPPDSAGTFQIFVYSVTVTGH